MSTTDPDPMCGCMLTLSPTSAAPILLLLMSVLSACPGPLYELPDPPAVPREVSLYPGEEQRARERDYVAARGVVIRISGLLNSKRYEEALELMSAETKDMLEYLSPKRGEEGAAVHALSEGTLMLGGAPRQVDVVELLVGSDLSEIEDAVEGVEEQETLQRKEIFVITEDKEPRRLVVIKQGGDWVLHRTKIVLD